jgi:hypothetical protein
MLRMQALSDMNLAAMETPVERVEEWPHYMAVLSNRSWYESAAPPEDDVCSQARLECGFIRLAVRTHRQICPSEIAYVLDELHRTVSSCK